VSPAAVTGRECELDHSPAQTATHTAEKHTLDTPPRPTHPPNAPPPQPQQPRRSNKTLTASSAARPPSTTSTSSCSALRAQARASAPRCCSTPCRRCRGPQRGRLGRCWSAIARRSASSLCRCVRGWGEVGGWGGTVWTAWLTDVLRMMI